MDDPYGECVPAVPDLDLARIRRYCDAKVPVELRVMIGCSPSASDATRALVADAPTSVAVEAVAVDLCSG